MFYDLVERPLKGGDAAAGCPPVDLELCFPGTPGSDASARTPSSGLAGEVCPLTRQSGQHIGELGELDLSLRFAGLGATGEDVEDETASIDDRAVDQRLEVSGLGGRKVIVEDDHVDFQFFDAFLYFIDFTTTDEVSRVESGAFLDGTIDDFGTGGVRKKGEFVERIVDSGSTRAREGDTHKESPFWTQGFREVVTSGVRPFVRVQSSGFDP